MIDEITAFFITVFTITTTLFTIINFNDFFSLYFSHTPRIKIIKKILKIIYWIILHETYEIKDYIFAPLLNGTDAITQWTSITSSTGNGIFQAHGAFLTDGWSNDGLWQLDFDVTANSWGYVGFLPICSDAINPYTDAKNKSYSLMCWEGISYPGGLNSSVVSEDPFTKITTTNEWHHMTIIKLSDTQIKIIIDNEYESIRNVPNLRNLQTLHIGSRDNQYDRNRGGLVYLKKIRVKAL